MYTEFFTQGQILERRAEVEWKRTDERVRNRQSGAERNREQANRDMVP